MAGKGEQEKEKPNAVSTDIRLWIVEAGGEGEKLQKEMILRTH